MIEQGQIYTVEFNNFRRVHRNRQGGELFAIELEVNEEEWHYLRDFPQDAIGNMAIQWTDRAARPQPEPRPKGQSKPKPDPTPYGQFWKILDAHGFHNRPDVRAWLSYEGVDESEAKEKMRTMLGITSRAREASPEFLLEVLRRSYSPIPLAGAITVVENAKVKTASP